MVIAEYIWYDGTFLRGKTKVFEKLDVLEFPELDVLEFPEWYDYVPDITGLEQKSILKPVRFYRDFSRGDTCFIVLCEVMNNGNYRAKLNNLLPSNLIIGFEQEYVVIDKKSELDFLKKSSSERLGIYSGVGGGRIVYRYFADKHFKSCINTGIKMFGMNAELKMGQWEYQIAHGPDILRVCDDLIVSRYLLERLSEEYNLQISYNPVHTHQPFCHINFSLLEPLNDTIITEIVDVFKEDNYKTLIAYGGSIERFNGNLVPTKEFKFGTYDKSASINYISDYNYFEDRRPPADVNPYKACLEIITTINKVFKK